MNWENLKLNRCPHCGNNLKEYISEYECTECTFHIEKTRFAAILQNRAYPDRKIVKLKWQNIKDDKCPVCSSDLKPNMEGAYEIMKCSSPECVFKIREDKLLSITSDPDHPANKFYNPWKRTQKRI